MSSSPSRFKQKILISGGIFLLFTLVFFLFYVREANIPIIIVTANQANIEFLNSNNRTVKSIRGEELKSLINDFRDSKRVIIPHVIRFTCKVNLMDDNGSVSETIIFSEGDYFRIIYLSDSILLQKSDSLFKTMKSKNKLSEYIKVDKDDGKTLAL